MKYLIIISLLVTLNSHAQEEKVQQNDDVKKTIKRPSWSQGLPERKSSMNPSTSMDRLKTYTKPQNAIEDHLNLQDTELPELEIDVVNSTPLMKFEVEPVKPIKITQQQAFDQYYNNRKEIKDEQNTTVNSLIAEYKWTPIKTSPINVSKDFDDTMTLKLNIQINPKGDVTRVTASDTVIPKSLFKNAEKSILNWKFQAPSKIGITENISKTFAIDINNEA